MKKYRNSKNGIYFARYSEEDLPSSTEINSDAFILLNKIGLPILESDYGLRFFPFRKPLFTSVATIPSIILGKPFRSGNDISDTILAIDTARTHVFFYSESLFEVGMLPQPVTMVNTSLTNFVSFCIEVTMFSRKVFQEGEFPNSSFVEVLSKFKSLIWGLSELDKPQIRLLNFLTRPL